MSETTCRFFAGDAPPRALGGTDEIAAALAEPNGFVWFDVVDPDEDARAILREVFGLHPLAIEDAVNAHQRAKIERYEKFWFVVAHGAYRTETGALAFAEIAVFVGPDFAVTVHRNPRFAPGEIERRWLQRGDARSDGSAVLYVVLDAVVDGYLPLADEIEDRLETLEGALLGSTPARGDTLLAMYALRKESHRLWRAVHPLRDATAPIARGDVPFVSAEGLPYFRDVFDHATRVAEQMEATRESIDGALDVEISVSANRQADVTKELTVIATIFLPLTFITGFFGQNFLFLTDRIRSSGAFFGLGIGTELAAVVVLLVYFRRKGWW